MNLDFNFNIGRNPVAAGQAAASAAPQGLADKGALRGANGLTVTQAPAAPEDIAAAGIPESALTRDDDLGRLVSSAFALPAPPMPDFGNS